METHGETEQQGVASENGKNRTLSFEQQRYRASGLNLVTAAVVLWNTVYLERATNALRGNGNGHAVDDALLQYVTARLGAHQLDRRLPSTAAPRSGKFRPLRPFPVLAYDFFRFLRPLVRRNPRKFCPRPNLSENR